MAEWLSTLRGALLLRSEAFLRFGRHPDVFGRGLVLIVAVAWLAGLPSFFANLATGFAAQPNPDSARAAAIADLERRLPGAGGLAAGQQPDIGNISVEPARQSFLMAVNIASQIEALPTMLPRPVGVALRSFGGWLSRPFQSGGSFPLAGAALGIWLGYGVWVTLAAHWLGGRGSLSGFFGATVLYAVPHVLGVAAAVPLLGPILGLVAFAWGGAIYVKATSVSQELSIERALLAVALPLVGAGLLALVLGLAGLASLVMMAVR